MIDPLLAQRILSQLRRAPRIGVAADELSRLLDEPAHNVDQALAELVDNGDAFTSTRHGAARYHPKGAVPL